jgi:hypothetical protein
MVSLLKQGMGLFYHGQSEALSSLFGLGMLPPQCCYLRIAKD